jgi:hypothetical protein
MSVIDLVSYRARLQLLDKLRTVQMNPTEVFLDVEIAVVLKSRQTSKKNI